MDSISRSEDAVDEAAYRRAIAQFATGVCVITAPGPVGMTANAVCSLSLDPLLLLVCFARTARTLPAVRSAGRFGVNVLAADQQDVARQFASKLPEDKKFGGIAHRLDPHGVPILNGVLAWFVCSLNDLVEAGDHEIGIGAVETLDCHDGPPLIWYGGRYGAFGPF